MQFDKPKFKRLVHYVAWKAGKRDWFGAVKLNKVLWFADARTYVLSGKSITGETYVREKYGPVPQHIMQVQKELQQEGVISVSKEGKLTRIIAKIPAERGWFSETELQSIDWWIDHIDKKHTAKSISEQTHDYVWEIAKMGEQLPLYAYRVARIQEPTDNELSRLKNRAKELGLI